MSSLQTFLAFCLLGLSVLQKGVNAQCDCIEVTHEWDGNYDAKFDVETTIALTSLSVNFTFSIPPDDMVYFQGPVEKIDDTHYRLTRDDIVAYPGDIVEVEFEVHFSSEETPVIIEVYMNGADICDGSGYWTTIAPLLNPCDPTGMEPHEYSQLLCMSYVFYEAERSGPLPADQRVTWRGDSALDDGKDVGLDLTGGYYDAGDHVKFGFPMAFTTTMLSWGLIDFADGHELAGQTDYGLAAVKWATDYFLKAYSAHDVFYGQVGLGTPDHGYWGRPEEMTMERPAMNIDDAKPGSDLAAETAAAMAAASIAFKDVDSDYSAKLLSVAKELYDFADQHREMYHNSITDAANFYRSWSGYGDELCWGALWLARATGNDTYLTKAREHYDEFDLGTGAEQFSWDDKKAGVYAIFSLLDPSPEYPDALQGYLDHVRNDKPYTPGGLVFLDMWGANRHAANVAFLALWAAKHDLNVDTNREWASGQINYLLGDGAGHSFVVGYGVDPPQRPHHRSSSCPSLPLECDTAWAQQQPGPNPQVLYGALVGGPDEDGTYADDRMDYVHNEVACDYNAAYTGALAAMTELHS